MEPDRPRSASGVGRGRFTRIPDNILWELLLVTEFFDGQARVFEGGIAQPEAKLESWSDLFLVRKVSMGCEKKMAGPGTHGIKPTIVDEESDYRCFVSKRVTRMTLRTYPSVYGMTMG